MGTNFYARIGVCKHCLAPKQEVHIGKSSIGWTFGFQSTDEIRSYKAWLKQLKKSNVEIYDEYGKRWCINDFKELVENKRTEKNKHAVMYPDGCFLDREGNSFHEGDFS